MLSILLVDDEPAVRAVLAEVLRDAGHVVTTAADGAQALAQLDAMRFDLAITDVRLPKADGFAILSRIRRDAAPTGLATDVILISAYGSIAEAVSAMKLRALDYLSKPVVPEQLLALVGQVDERRRLQAERARFQLEAESQSGTPLLGRSPAMARLRQRIDQVAASDANVLLVGEPGTGKELVARVIHQRSARRAARFIAVSCAATTAAALEEELLGRDGANGSAIGSDGRLAAAEGGTLLLDAVAEVPREVQGRLLRALVPEGAEAAPPDVRIVS